MFILDEKKLIRGCKAHVLAGLGCGADYVAKIGTIGKMPFEGTTEHYYGPQGGNWCRIIRKKNGHRIELAHLSAYLVKPGYHRAGEKIIKTGNTGAITTGPHLHVQIFDANGKRIDPETYDWSDETPMPIDIPKLFLQVWKVVGAPGDIAYFQRRIKNGSVHNDQEMIALMNKWYKVVYPNGKYSKIGNAKWQFEKSIH